MEKLVKRMMKGRFTLKELGIDLAVIRQLKDMGYRVRNQAVNGKMYFYIVQGNEMTSLFLSGLSHKPTEYKWIELSDLHFGSYQQDEEGLKDCLQRAVDEGFTEAHVMGDTVDGYKIYPGHMTNLRYWREEDQAAKAVEVLSQFPLKYIACKGNHCYSYEMQGGPPVGELIARQMENYIYLDSFAADLIIGGAARRIIHGMTGRSYSRSYPGQCYVRDLLDAQGEHVWVRGKKYRLRFLGIGHFHFEATYESAGIHVTHPGCFQFPNDYTIRRGLVGPTGCRFTTVVMQDGKVLDYTSKFVKPRR